MIFFAIECISSTSNHLILSYISNKENSDMKKDKTFLRAHFSLQNFHTKCLDEKICDNILKISGVDK